MRLTKKSHEFLTKIFRAAPERSRNDLEEIAGENFVKLSDGNFSVFQKKRVSGAMANDFTTFDEKDEMHQVMMEIEPLLIASVYRIWRNVLLTHWSTLFTAWRRRSGITRGQIFCWCRMPENYSPWGYSTRPRMCQHCWSAPC